ncbi:FG-GAP repeat protein [Wenzhouxiangella sp. XN24]|uniref:FG-GAP repeat protein n=1 Tax=Wenzhouxiangella sp. XN24 TaxID=2713569 RepID=UPI00197CCD71|nr:FG-GAP repeat protein [Wenzhouxiangella sp. XN24]
MEDSQTLLVARGSAGRRSGIHSPLPRLAALALISCLGLAACGGGGGGGGTPSFTVTPSAGANGSIAPATAQTVTQGQVTSFTITPASGFGIAAVTGCGGTLAGNTFTTAAITANCTVSATFEALPAAPALTLTPEAIKTFAFSWAAVPGASEYRLFENPDGGSGYTQVATAPGTDTGLDLEVFLPGRVNASYILEACNSGGCTDSNTVFVSGTLAEAVGYVKASNTGLFDAFGVSLALSGDGTTLAVAARQEDSNAIGIDGNQGDDSVVNSGSVYVFIRDGASWMQQAYVKASNTGTNDEFGAAIALSDDGSTLAVGAWDEDSNATGVNADEGDDSAPESGAVYVYTRSGTSWSQQAYIKASNTGQDDEFGTSVALSGDGDTLAVGAVGESSSDTGIESNQGDDNAPDSGAVYVFTRSGTSWSQQAYVKAANTDQDDEFGTAVALSDDGSTLAVGARGEDGNTTGVNGNGSDNNAPGSGAAYVFTRDGTSWSQQAYIKASNTGQQDMFGRAVALSGDGETLAVGAVAEDSSATGIDGNGDDDNVFGSGAVYVYTRSGTSWSQQAYVKASNPGLNDVFGHSLALSDNGNALVVGATGEGSNATGIGGDQAEDNTTSGSGAVYVFARTGTIWAQQAYVKAANTDQGDAFGFDVALSGDGTTLAAGATNEDGSATGIGGNQDDNALPGSGAVYLY